jgi:hypothetical protein
MGKFRGEDLTGKRFNKLVVVGWSGDTYWNCLCDCGNACTARKTGLTSGHRFSCGCDTRCVAVNKKNKDIFVERANLLGLNSFNDYGEVVYESMKNKVKIKCKVHNEVYWQPPADHLRYKGGCPKCISEKSSVSQRLTYEEFLDRAYATHGDVKYNYSQVDYKGNKHKVVISCNDCGVDFTQTPDSHIAGAGCRLCANKVISQKKLWTKEKFEKESRAIHGDKYSYEKVEYRGCYEPVTLMCNICNTAFDKVPAHVIQGLGCPCQNECNYGFQSSKAGLLYVLTCGESTKIGITNRTALDRSISVSRTSKRDFIVVKEYFLSGVNCRKLEKALLNYFKKQYKQYDAKFDGWTETFIGLDADEAVDIIDCLVDMGIE